MKVIKVICRLVTVVLALVSALWAVNTVAGTNLIANTAFGEGNEIVLTFAQPLAEGHLLEPGSYTVYEESDPDIRLQVSTIKVALMELLPSSALLNL